MASRLGSTTADDIPSPAGTARGSTIRLDGAVDLARDRELVERCQAGDRGAFEELYHRYHRRLFHFCLRRLHEPYEAEDAAQEAFTKAWRALPSFAGERRFYPWLTVIAANVCTDVLRRRSRQTPMEEVPLAAADLECGEVDESLLKQVDARIALQALGNLSDRHQRVLRLREGSGWSTQRLAEHEGVAVPAMETLLWRARQALKREFAAIAETGGRLGVLLGLGAASLRRLLGRAGSRIGSHLPVLDAVATRNPVAVGSSLLLAGGVLAGGVAYVASSAANPSGGVQLPASHTTADSGAVSSVLPPGARAGSPATAPSTAGSPGGSASATPPSSGTP
ncbi:MAG: RNA polymerase sigma factor, partial [Acidimicrobiales bacterium]